MPVAYSSGAIHFTGLGSNTDFDTMIDQLKQIESYPKARLTLWQADWQKRITAFQTLNSSMLTLNSTLSSMNTLDKFLVKNAVSSKPDTISAVATGSAVNNTNKIEIANLASNCTYTYTGYNFTGLNDKVNTTNTTQNFCYTYKGKDYKVAVGSNATIQQFVNQINNDPNNPGVRASLIKSGTDYLFQFQGMDTGKNATLSVSPWSSNQLQIKPASAATSGWDTTGNTGRLASDMRFANANTVINNTLGTETFTYSYGGTPSSVSVNSGDSLTDLATKINAGSDNVRAEVCKDSKGYYLQLTGTDPSISPGPSIDPSSSSLLAIAPQTSGQSSWASSTSTMTASGMSFNDPTNIINSTGSAQTLAFSFKGKNYSVGIGDGKTLQDAVDDINSYCTGQNISVKASIYSDAPGVYRLALNNTTAKSTDVPQITSASSAAFNGGFWNEKTSDHSITYSTQFSSGNAVVNSSGSAQTFSFMYEGAQKDISVAAGATLNDLVNGINTSTAPGVASIKTVSGKSVLCLTGSSTTPQMCATSSSNLAVGAGSWTGNGSTLSFGPAIGSASTVINNSSQAGTFAYTYKNQDRSVTLAPGATLQTLISAINSDPANSGLLEAGLDNGKFYIRETPKVNVGSNTITSLGTSSWTGSSSTLTFSGSIPSASTVVNSSGSNQTLTYSYKGGTNRSVTLADGATAQDLVNAINSDPANANILQAGISNGKFYIKESSSIDAPSNPDISIGTGTWSASAKTLTFGTSFSSTTQVINSSGSPQTFSYTNKGVTRTVNLADGATAQNLIDSINNDPVNANCIKAGFSNGKIVLSDIEKSESPQIKDTSSNNLLIAPPSGWGSVRNGASSTLATTFTAADINSSINTTTDTKKFSYTYEGKTYSVKVEGGTTLAGLVDKINKNDNSPGVMASLVYDAGSNSYAFRLTGLNPGSAAPVVAPESSREISITPPDCSYTGQQAAVANFSTSFADGDAVINTSGKDQSMILQYNGKSYTIKVADGTKLKDLVSQINSTSMPIRASTTPDGGGGVSFQIWGTDPSNPNPPALSISSSSDLAIAPPNMAGEGWSIQKPDNARVKLNDWPAGPDDWIESETNSPTELVTGVTLNFKDVGTAQVTVNTDAGSIKEQIKSFVDALNQVRTMVKSLTAVDSNKQVAQIGKTASNFDAQIGSVLTGNYGVQLLSSKLKDAAASSATGFEYYSKDKDGVTHGDLYTALGQIGITTVAQTNDPNFGLLVIDDAKLDEALNRDPKAVAELFAADNIARTDSPDFTFASYITGSTKPGAYKVNYTVAADGSITGTIGGYKASFDKGTGQLTAIDGPARGLALNINSMSPGSYQGNIDVKMGKVGELQNLTTELNSSKGILSILQNNYKEISNNIQNKIDKEDERLVLWERDTRSRFANLEKVLSTYNSLSQQVSSSIKQLPSVSK